MRVYTTQDLRLVRAMNLPAPTELRATGPVTGKDVMVTGPDEATVFYAGLLTRWRISDGTPLGNPLPVFANPEDLSILAQAGKAVERSDHPEQIILMSPDGLSLWDIRERRELRSWRRETMSPMPTYRYLPGRPEIYVGQKIWNLDTGALTTPTHPVPDPGSVKGNTANGLIIAAKSDSIEIWDADRGRLFDFHPPGPGLEAVGAPTGMVLMSQDGPATIDLTRADALARLCAISDREYTGAERAALPIGADTTTPCR